MAHRRARRKCGKKARKQARESWCESAVGSFLESLVAVVIDKVCNETECCKWLCSGGAYFSIMMVLLAVEPIVDSSFYDTFSFLILLATLFIDI